MKILCTGQGTFTGDDLQEGKYYEVQEYDEGTAQQNKFFHKLLQIYYASGAYSYPANNFEDLKNQIKDKLGAGAESYIYIDTEGKKRRSKELPENVMEHNGEMYVWKKLLSWSKYTKKQRKNTIDNLIRDMMTAGVNMKEFHDILTEMENKTFNKPIDN